jgi:hypothetical protein
MNNNELSEQNMKIGIFFLAPKRVVKKKRGGKEKMQKKFK